MATPLKVRGGRFPEIPSAAESITLLVHDNHYVVADTVQYHCETLDDALEWFDELTEPWMVDVDTSKVE